LQDALGVDAGTFFGAGRMRPGPGTYGSVAALLLWYCGAHLFHPDRLSLAIATAVAALIITLIGIPASTIVARESGRQDLGLWLSTRLRPVDRAHRHPSRLAACRACAAALPPLRYLEAVAHPQTGGAARGHRNYAGRCGSGSARAGGRVGGWALALVCAAARHGLR